MSGEPARTAFEAWILSQGLEPLRVPGQPTYQDPQMQAQWVSWNEGWTRANLILNAPGRCWISRDLMVRVHNALRYYGNPDSYLGARSPGRLRGYLREVRPTAQQLSLSAQLLLREIDRIGHTD